MATELTRRDRLVGDLKNYDEYYATGSGAMDHTLTIAQTFILEEVRLHMSATGSTDEDFTIGVNSINGAGYDTVLARVNMLIDLDGNTGVTDVVFRPDSPLKVSREDFLDFDFANTNTKTWGLTVIVQVR